MEELEMSPYATSYELGTVKRTRGSSVNPQQTNKRLLRFGILTLGVLSVIQATLNITLRLVLYSEDTDEFPFNSSAIGVLCQTDQTQQVSSQSPSCCNKMLRILLRKYKALEKERDRLQDIVHQLNRDKNIEVEPGSGSGSGFEYEYQYDFDSEH